VRAVDRVGDPTAASPMPAFALQNFVQRGAWAHRRSHGAEHARMCFFLKRAFPQKFLHVLFISQGALCLFVKFGFLTLFYCFHSPNGDFGASDFVPPSAALSPDRVLYRRRFLTEVYPVFLPPLCMSFFCFA